ncbi:DUF4433 domain-containing protein [soil metagenome]
MSPPPARPQIYHITHGRNLAGIIADGCLWSDAEMIARGGPGAVIGISKIKKRRLDELAVSCHPGTKVGEFVPFNFCPRSVMLHILHRANHPDLTYREGQRPILHLVADLHEVVAWADSQRRPWAFIDRNAGSRYFQSFRDVSQLDQLRWDHIANPDFREPEVKDAKQAEFLVFGSFPWPLVRSIGVISEKHAERVREIVSASEHQPDVRVQAGWYY